MSNDNIIPLKQPEENSTDTDTLTFRSSQFNNGLETRLLIRKVLLPFPETCDAGQYKIVP